MVVSAIGTMLMIIAARSRTGIGMGMAAFFMGMIAVVVSLRIA
jgi:hypothetical protein